MLRKIVSGLSLVAIVATGAAAQVPFQESFVYLGNTTPHADVTHYNNFSGKFTSTNNIASTGELLGQGFQIWCVDPLQDVSFGDVNSPVYNAWITPVNTSTSPDDFNHTFAERTQTGHVASFGAAAQLEYEQASYLASEMTNSTTPGMTSYDYRDAMWTVMGYSGYNSAAALALIAGINLSDPNFHANEWGVITAGNDVQEFIYHRENGGFLSNTPEPATMSMMAMGLVGMAGSTIRRRKQRKA